MAGQVDVVVAEEVGLDSVPVVVEEGYEAGDSPVDVP